MPGKHHNTGQNSDFFQQFTFENLAIDRDSPHRFCQNVYCSSIQNPKHIFRITRLHRSTQDQDGTRKALHHLTRQGPTVHLGHVQIGANHIRIEPGNEVECLLAVARCADDFNAVGIGQHPLQKQQDNRSIFNEQHTNGQS
jgi:hypothetical protein